MPASRAKRSPISFRELRHAEQQAALSAAAAQRVAFSPTILGLAAARLQAGREIREPAENHPSTHAR
jgi:hypothetical protein